MTKATLWNEEIFGPVLAVRKFSTEQEAVALANDSDYDLAGAVMCADKVRCEQVARALKAGIVWTNRSQPTFVQAPWGWYLENIIEHKTSSSF